jgi:hypothetical protein
MLATRRAERLEAHEKGIRCACLAPRSPVFWSVTSPTIIHGEPKRSARRTDHRHHPIRGNRALHQSSADVVSLWLACPLRVKARMDQTTMLVATRNLVSDWR